MFRRAARIGLNWSSPVEHGQTWPQAIRPVPRSHFSCASVSGLGWDNGWAWFSERISVTFLRMCNRYSSTKNEVQVTLRHAVLKFMQAVRYNIAPTQRAPVVLVEGEKAVMRELVWGWSSQHGPITNARAETAAFKMFKESLQKRRCLVPADGFYEWKTMSDGKQPYRFIRHGGETFWFAGLWQGEQFTIMTAPARGCVAEFHDRMPIILRPDDLAWWVSDEVLDGIELIARAGTDEELECYPVTRRMSNSRYVAPDCIEKISIEEKQLGLF